MLCILYLVGICRMKKCTFDHSHKIKKQDIEYAINILSEKECNKDKCLTNICLKKHETDSKNKYNKMLKFCLYVFDNKITNPLHNYELQISFYKIFKKNMSCALYFMYDKCPYNINLCVYKHDPITIEEFENMVNEISKIKCKNGNMCCDKNCKYTHPNDAIDKYDKIIQEKRITMKNIKVDIGKKRKITHEIEPTYKKSLSNNDEEINNIITFVNNEISKGLFNYDFWKDKNNSYFRYALLIKEDNCNYLYTKVINIICCTELQETKIDNNYLLKKFNDEKNYPTTIIENIQSSQYIIHKTIYQVVTFY